MWSRFTFGLRKVFVDTLRFLVGPDRRSTVFYVTESWKDRKCCVFRDWIFLIWLTVPLSLLLQIKHFTEQIEGSEPRAPFGVDFKEDQQGQSINFILLSCSGDFIHSSDWVQSVGLDHPLSLHNNLFAQRLVGSTPTKRNGVSHSNGETPSPSEAPCKR